MIMPINCFAAATPEVEKAHRADVIDGGQVGLVDCWLILEPLPYPMSRIVGGGVRLSAPLLRHSGAAM